MKIFLKNSKSYIVPAVRAFQLIPMMYNRLTLIDGLSHSEAWMKICQDHKDLPGFSRRNIYRYLPSDNPNIPRRVVPLWHKSKIIKFNTNSLHCGPKTDKTSGPESENKSENICPFCEELQQKNYELEIALEESSRPILAAKFTTNIIKYTLPKEKHPRFLEAMNNCNELIHLEFDKAGNFISVISDIDSVNSVSLS